MSQLLLIFSATLQPWLIFSTRKLGIDRIVAGQGQVVDVYKAPETRVGRRCHLDQQSICTTTVITTPLVLVKTVNRLLQIGIKRRVNFYLASTPR